MGLLFSILAPFYFGFQSCSNFSKAEDQPNILLIIVDQLSAKVLDNSKCTWVNTPNIDRLSEKGVTFSNAYSAFPLCNPSRAAFFTGRYPFEVKNKIMAHKSLGTIMRDAGYLTQYIGKWHVGHTNIERDDEVLKWSGFDDYLNGNDQVLQEKTIEFLTEDHKKPFFLVASFMNPHDCCELARNIGRWDINNGFEKGACTPNFTIPSDKHIPSPHSLHDPEITPEVMLHQKPLDRKNYISIRPTGDWTEEDWKVYRYGYSQLAECIDARIGLIMETLEKQGLEKNTVVIFISDHGDGLGEHGWNQKHALYEEMVKVPFIIVAPDNGGNGKSHQLINTGIDLLPTILDFAGIQNSSYPGKSLKKSIKHADYKISGREYIVSELDLNIQGLGLDYVPKGADLDRLSKFQEAKARMITNGILKYIVYDMGENPEILFDIQKNPNETTNLINDPQYTDELVLLKNKLQEHLRESSDNF